VKGDKALLVYDKHDVWAVDPRGELPPACVTDGAGRAGGLRFRRVRLDPEERAIDPERPMLLSAFHLTTKATGFYRDRVHGTDKPQKLVLLNESLGRPEKAEAADRLLFTRSTFRKFPDLWVSDGDFKGMARVSDANPQQKDYLWGTAELVEWNSLDGERLQGILYRPEGFDPKKKYPMLVYFYERLSDTLHRHFVPAPGSSSINISFYVSRGYVVFVPDIPYRVGHPGQSCLNAVLPGVMKLVNEGFVDKARVGVQGHSWGGYQVAYLLTRTSLFAAAEAGAPVSNMTSAYGGIRWGTGMSRMFQYEKTQSRIGGTLWDAQQRYIENSPVFWADRVETPLLLMHNDQDGAVPWYQGIEMFVALRRLGKPCWLVNYNGADHGLRRDEDKRDWAVRMQQFFDHYLKGAPPPVWLADGIPAEKKGRTLGLDLVKPDKNSKN
ncbi:MAG TPA: prolyl oligopeptidase family serine peptidase, partial [Gemmataceae bacterium]